MSKIIQFRHKNTDKIMYERPIMGASKHFVIFKQDGLIYFAICDRPNLKEYEYYDEDCVCIGKNDALEELYYRAYDEYIKKILSEPQNSSRQENEP